MNDIHELQPAVSVSHTMSIGMWPNFQFICAFSSYQRVFNYVTWKCWTVTKHVYQSRLVWSLNVIGVH